MDELLSLLIFAGLFFIMMRFGCGAHMFHKHSSNRSSTDYIDPVCKTKVAPDQGYGVMHKGELVRFCSRKCMDEFEQEPEKYLFNRDEENGL